MTGKKKEDGKEYRLNMMMNIHEALVTLKGSGTVAQIRDRMAERGYDRGSSTVSEAMKELWKNGLVNRENAKGKRMKDGHCETGRTYVYSLKTNEEWLAEDFAKMGVVITDGTLRAPAQTSKGAVRMPAIKPISVGEPETELMTKEMKERQQKIKENAKTEQRHDQRPKIVGPPKKEEEPVQEQPRPEVKQPEVKQTEPVRTVGVVRMGWAQALEQAYMGKKVVSDATGCIYGLGDKQGLVSVKDGRPVTGFPEKERIGTWHVFVEALSCPFCGSDAKVTHLTMSGGVQRYRCTCTNEECCAAGPLGNTVEDATIKYNKRQ